MQGADLADLIDALGDDSPVISDTARLAVRVHRLTHAQLLRICKWAKRMPIDILADCTLPAGQRAVSTLMEQVKAHALEERVRVLSFTSHDMERAYPSLRHPALEDYRRKHMWMMPALSHAWAYTAEALVVCGLGRENQQVTGGLRYDLEPQSHIWVFEHDCDYAGPIDELVHAYAHDDADLVAKELVPQARIGTDWMWYGCATPSFLSRYGRCRSCAHVHAVRISLRLLRKLHEAALAGEIGYGEMAIPTVCMGEGMLWRPLRDEHIGQPYDPQGHMDQASFEELESRRDGRLYHALKY